MAKQQDQVVSFSPSTFPAKLKLYNPCHLERTLLYQTIAEHFEAWLDDKAQAVLDALSDYAEQILPDID